MFELAEIAVIEELNREVARRRTFAIISHPDAGKTTLTEKLLLYSGAIELAGAVKARKNQRQTTSDWMEMEQSRGISITSTALQFDYQNHRFNLLDTPGHQDFSEDTYRTLMAVDSAVMVLDSAKGIEPQTKKLFDVCRMRHIPILIFINKMDQPGRAPLDLLDEIERVLGMGAVPRNWPIGEGGEFQGVYDLELKQVLRFQRTAHGQQKAPVWVGEIDNPHLSEEIGDQPYRQLCEEVELLTGAGFSFDREKFLKGDVAPVFFGSAIHNFGVEPFLTGLKELAPPPGPRMSSHGLVTPGIEAFSGFIFKIQANMDRRHRDRMAFLRVCSGRFEKDMVVHHARLARTVRMTRPHRLFGRDRETIEEAYAGDVVGLVNPGLFAIGDTLCSAAPIQFDGIPRFHPECFGMLINRTLSKNKQFQKGLEQLEEEGVMQVLFSPDGVRREPILAVVGNLQFDVVQARLQYEYGVETTVERLSYTCARWVGGNPEAISRLVRDRWEGMRLQDRSGQMVALFSTDREFAFQKKHYPEIDFKELK
jgi:peptide chain release factor 3